MTTQTIALLGGVVVLLLLLVAVRRRRAKAEAAPAQTRVHDVADDIQTPAAIAGPARLSAAEGIPETPPVQAPVAPGSPAAAEPLVVPQSWTSEDIVREPGWLMPGEVDNVWQAEFAAAANAAVPAGAGVPVGAVGHANGNGNGNGASAPNMGSLVDGAIPGFDPAAGWSGSTTVEMDRLGPDDEPSIPQWDPVEDLPAGDGGDPPADLAMAAWSEDALVGWSEPAVEPDVEAWAAQVEPAVVEPVIPEAVVPEVVVPEVEAFAIPPVEAVAIPPVEEIPVVEPEPVVPEAIVPEPVAVEELAAWPVAEWAVEAPVEEPAEILVEDPVELAPEPAAEIAVPEAPVVAWWDEEVEVEVEVDEEPEAVTADDTDAGTGRFALGGFALQPGHEAIAGVTFRGALAAAPTAWAVAPADEVAPGTLVLSVDGAVNAGADEVAVLMDEGFAPSPEGFTVRAAARAAGPFAVSGTFRVH